MVKLKLEHMLTKQADKRLNENQAVDKLHFLFSLVLTVSVSVYQKLFKLILNMIQLLHN